MTVRRFVNSTEYFAFHKKSWHNLASRKRRVCFFFQMRCDAIFNEARFVSGAK